VLEYLRGLEAETDDEGYLRPTRQQEAETGIAITRIFLDRGASSFIGYQGIGEETPPESERLESWPQGLTPLEPLPGGHKKIGRNDSCPCGSGKKYKKCCCRRDTR